MLTLAIAAAVFIGAFIIGVAPTGRLGYEDRDLPDEEKRGVSFVPVLVVIPLFVGGLVWVADLLLGQIGVIAVLILYALVVCWAIGDFVYWARKQ